ncbi:MAG: FAD-dependent oxidoreductase [Proteobacteria bacterium]|nr:MAG: FAD-dependent oxidoreductase [Pseudomonadota bacterium]
MSTSIPDSCEIVIIGGGIIGCSVAYHLAKLGCKEVVLLDKNTLTSGSTWHAAGAVGQLRSSANITRLLGYSVDLYSRLEAETGQATGWRQNGSIRLAYTDARRTEYEIAATMAHSFGLSFEIISAREAEDMVPALRTTDDLVCAAFVESDGVAMPSDLTMALAKGARSGGVRIFEGVAVTGFDTHNGAVTGVITAQHGTIKCEKVVNCAGIWSRQLGRLAGVNVAVQPSYHQYFVTEPIEGLPHNAPTVRDPDHLTYFKEEVGGLAVGGYELNPRAFEEATVPEQFEFQLFEEDLARFEPLMHNAIERFPALETTGIKQWFHGLESFTEDGMFILGEAPELRGFYVGTGFNAFGIAAAGGAGRVLAEWMVDGDQPFDLWSADIRRFGRYHADDRQNRMRALEGQARHYQMGWPYYEHSAARPLRRSPVYERLAAKGGCFGSKSGWERANWFAPSGIEPRDEYSFDRQNWFPHSAAEHAACRHAVAIFDQSSFAKFSLVGKDSERVMSRLCASNVACEVGRVVYSQLLNRNGGIACDLTVTRISGDEYYIVTGTGFAVHDFNHIKRQIRSSDEVRLIDVTSAFATLSVMGPNAREMMSSITQGDLGNAGFPFATCRDILVAGAPVRALRLTFVGELGWELHVPSEYALAVYDAIQSAGGEYGLRDAGYRAIDSLRLEKGYRLWGSDIGPDYTPYEAGLGFAVAIDSNTEFIGRDALLRQRERPLTKRLVTFTHTSPGMPLRGGETIYRDGERVGWITSGGYGHTLGCDIGLGYVRHDGGIGNDYLLSGNYELEIRTGKVPADIHLNALYDPKNTRVKS